MAAGGATNHRIGLYDAILIAENHIAAAGGIARPWRVRARPLRIGGTLEVEVRNPEEIEQRCGRGPRLLLDNMSVQELSAAVAQVAGRGSSRPAAT